jgi:hypothetical protein
MLFVEYTVGGLAVVLTILAYMQKDVLSYLKINIFAALFFGLTLIFDDGFTGGLISLLTMCLYIVAIYSSKETRKKLSYYIPPIAFALAYYVHDASAGEIEFLFDTVTVPTNYFPALGSLFVTLASLQTKILLNKILLIAGLILWAIYSLYLNAWFALAADSVGIVTLVISIVYLRLNIDKQLPHK